VEGGIVEGIMCKLIPCRGGGYNLEVALGEHGIPVEGGTYTKTSVKSCYVEGGGRKKVFWGGVTCINTLCGKAGALKSV